MNKEKLFRVISNVAGLLITIILAFVSIPEIVKTYGYMWGIYSIIIISFAWLTSVCFLMIVPSIKERRNVLWNIKKEKASEKLRLSIDVHKSPFWEKDDQFLLCIHNENWFRDIKSISVGIAFISKYKKGNEPSDFSLNRSVILRENINISKGTEIDLPFIEVVKKENRFIIRVIYPENPDKEFSELDFPAGKYDIQLWVKRNDTKSSYVLPIIADYSGWDKMAIETFYNTGKNIVLP